MLRTFAMRLAIPRPRDFKGSTLCFVAVEDERLAAEARAAAKGAGALVNVADRPQLCDFIMPSIVDRSPLVIAISTGGASPILGRMLKARLESSIPAAYGRLADLMGGFRGAVAKAIASPVMRRRFWETVLEGPIAERALSGDDNAASAELARAIEREAAECGGAARRGLSRRRRAWRSRPSDLPRPSAHAKGRCRALRPAHQPERDEPGAPRGRAHLRRQAAGGPRTAARRHQRAHGQARQRGQAGVAAQGRRSVHVRPGRRGDRSPRRGGDPVSGLSRDHGGDRRGGLCGHSPHPSRPRAGLRIRDRPRQGRQNRSRLDGALATAPDGCDLYGAAQRRGADARVHCAGRRPGFAGGDH